MRRLLLAAAVTASVLAGSPAASACTLETCWFTQPVCSRVSCRVCFYSAPPGDPFCID